MTFKTVADLDAGTPPYAADALVELLVPNGGGFDVVKAAYGDLAVMSPLYRFDVTTPVPVVDLVLPEGLKRFRVQIEDLVFNVTEYLNCRVSFDDGATFVDDADAYRTTTLGALPDSTVAALVFIDGSLYLSEFQDNAVGLPRMLVDIDIAPGSDVIRPVIRASATSYTTSYGTGADEGMTINSASGSLNPLAASPPPLARISAIRLSPYDGANTIDGGTFTLWGVPG
jgi:hypothetical protein